MPWVVRDVVNDVNKAVARRWQSLDPLLPEPNDLPEGCMAPFLANGGNGRPAGLAVCRHQHVPADTLAQTWGAATRFVLTMRLLEPDTGAATDDLLTQWRDHLQNQQEATADDTAYLQTMFVEPGQRGGGVGAALAARVHHELDARGIDVTLLHYSQLNPLSAPFWHRMGYRPLWTTWEARPAATIC
jgi:GNAT superfamily N-acetyltransferase